MLSSYSREALKKVSTATLTTVLFKRGLRNVFIQGIFLLSANKSARMVGEAFTLRYIPAREDIDQLGAFEGRGHPQREAIEACPPGHVLVMDARRDACSRKRERAEQSQHGLKPPLRSELHDNRRPIPIQGRNYLRPFFQASNSALVSALGG